jgi:D-lactate dehydrogenase (cytochrome)
MTEEYEDYLHDESRTGGGYADSISFPCSEEDVIAVMKECSDADTAVTVQGGRTGLTAAAVPYGGHVMNLSGMDGIGEIEEDERGVHVKVQPGVLLEKLNEYIREKRADLFFSPDPTETTADIGGMIACNASGAKSFRYGAVRDHVTALRIVLADGETVVLRRGEHRAEGRKLELTAESGRHYCIDLPTYRMPDVTKNTSGYYAEDDMDAVDLFIGSNGTLGIITEAELELLRKKPQDIGLMFFFTDEKCALDFTDAVRKSDICPVSIEFFDRHALEILEEKSRADQNSSYMREMPAGTAAAIFTELQENSEDEIYDKLETAAGIVEETGGDADKIWVADTPGTMKNMMDFRHAVPESVNALIDVRKQEHPGIAKLGTDMSVPDDRLKDVFAMYRRGLAEYGFESATWGHIGSNHVHVNILPRNEEEFGREHELQAKWAGEIAAMGGAVSAEHGVGKNKAFMLGIMYGEKGIAEMKAVKAALDPKGLLCPGNLFGTDGE